MELLLASLAAYAASRVLADEGAQTSAPASPASATPPASPASATPPASPAAQPHQSAPAGLAGRDALAAMGIIPGAPKVVTDLRAELDRTAKATAQPARSATSPATAAPTTLEQLANQRATQQTKLFAMPAGDATVNPVGTGVAVALDRLPADHYTFADGWYRARA